MSFLLLDMLLYNGDPPTQSYVTRVWRSHHHNIKIRNKKRFERWAVCDELDRSLRETIDTHKNAEELKASKIKHVRMVML